MLPNFAYIRARTKQEALDNLASEGAHAHAGGTDLLPNMKRRQQVPKTLVALRGESLSHHARSVRHSRSSATGKVKPHSLASFAGSAIADPAGIGVAW